MDVALDDLLILEPRLMALEPTANSEVATTGEGVPVSWAVTARLTVPHLPALHGGELILLPTRVVDGLGMALPALLREAHLLQASGVVVEQRAEPAIRSWTSASPVALFAWRGEITPDTETIINRELTECRGNLYRVGSEIERRMADVAVQSAGIAALARVASAASGLPIAVRDASGRLLATAPDEDAPGLDAGEGSWDVRQSLDSGAVLILGPLRADQRVVARFLVGRIGAAADAALRRDEAARPRGRQRVEAMQSLLSGQRADLGDQRTAALALGLDPDALFYVAVSNGGAEPALGRALSSLGAVHFAGGVNGRHVALVATESRRPLADRQRQVADIKRRWDAEHLDDGATLALSAPAAGVGSVPGAARQATFLANLQAQERFSRRAASFESVEDIGELRLLYELRDSSELRAFVGQALGGLVQRDSRGSLRETLRAFLDSGGSQVDAAHRLGVHRNTLAYRLRRIGELVGRDVSDPASWLTLHLALRAREMLEVYDDER